MIDWFDLHEVQGTLKILLQHNLKASVLQHSAFFMAQLSHLYMTTGKTIALLDLCWESDISLLFNILSRFVIFPFIHWRRKWQPTPVVLPGESQGRGSLVGCRLWDCTESDTTEVT